MNNPLGPMQNVAECVCVYVIGIFYSLLRKKNAICALEASIDKKCELSLGWTSQKMAIIRHPQGAIMKLII